MIKYFDFEKSIEDLDKKINLIKNSNEENKEKILENYNSEKKILFKNIYSSLNSWQKVLPLYPISPIN